MLLCYWLLMRDPTKWSPAASASARGGARGCLMAKRAIARPVNIERPDPESVRNEKRNWKKQKKKEKWSQIG